MPLERPSERDYPCFFCAESKTKDLGASCPRCGQPIDAGPLFQDQMVGGYRLVKHVRRGFYGATFSAENRIRKQFAVKIIPRLLYKQQGKSFEEEIPKYRGLGSHPNIAELMDADEAELTTQSGRLPIYYIVSEWVQGQSLHEFIKRTDLTVAEMYGAVLDIASGVARFEAKNLWHNDLNSDNILIRRLSQEERETRRSESCYICKIVDIGSAVVRQAERRAIPDDVTFLGLHIREMRNALLRNTAKLTKEDQYFLEELAKVIAHILDEDPARSVDRVQTALNEIKTLYEHRHIPKEEEEVELSDPFAYLNANDFPTEKYTTRLFSDLFPWLTSIVSPETQNMLITGPRGSGKTIILRSMRLKTRFLTRRENETTAAAAERLRSDRLAGFFVSARIEIGNNCPLTKLPQWAQSEELVNLYFNLLLTHEVVGAIHSGKMKGFLPVPPEAEWKLTSYVCNALGSSSAVGFAGLIDVISRLQHQIISDEYSATVSPSAVGPSYLSQLCALLKTEIPFFAEKNIVFLLDDFSLPRVPDAIQRALLPIIWNPGGGYCFRVTAHSESLVSEDLRRNTYLPNREYAEVNLGASYINNVDIEKNLANIQQCVDDILKKRFALNRSFQSRTVEKLLGNRSSDELGIAQRIRELTAHKKARVFRYAGWSTIIKLCSGDISYVIDVLRRILEVAPGKYPVGVMVQHKEIRRYARSELYRLQDYSVETCNLYEVATHFGKLSLFKLLHDDVGKEKRPAEYLRIEVETDALSGAAKHALADLLRNGVFIDAGFSSSSKGTPARRLIFKKMFTPVFPTTYNSRDTFPMSAGHFIEFVEDPAKFVKRIMGEEGIPPEEQQVELDRQLPLADWQHNYVSGSPHLNEDGPEYCSSPE